MPPWDRIVDIRPQRRKGLCQDREVNRLKPCMELKGLIVADKFHKNTLIDKTEHTCRCVLVHFHKRHVHVHANNEKINKASVTTLSTGKHFIGGKRAFQVSYTDVVFLSLAEYIHKYVILRVYRRSLTKVILLCTYERITGVV